MLVESLAIAIVDDCLFAKINDTTSVLITRADSNEQSPTGSDFVLFAVSV